MDEDPKAAVKEVDPDEHEPARRLAVARLGKLTPESASPEQQMWHTYPPVEMPSVEGVVGALTRPETWPASELFWGQGDIARVGMLHQLALQVR
jgi:hypothetical protein